MDVKKIKTIQLSQTKADLLESLTPSSPATPLELFMLKNINVYSPEQGVASILVTEAGEIHPLPFDNPWIHQ